MPHTFCQSAVRLTPTLSPPNLFYHLETILGSAAASWLARPARLKALDQAREANPTWFQSQHMLGAVCYVDLFAGNLDGIYAKIPYFEELGLTYLHLMPLFATPAGNNDGGYAVSSYRAVNPALGTMEQLQALADALRGALPAWPTRAVGAATRGEKDLTGRGER